MYIVYIKRIHSRTRNTHLHTNFNHSSLSLMAPVAAAAHLRRYGSEKEDCAALLRSHTDTYTHTHAHKKREEERTFPLPVNMWSVITTPFLYDYICRIHVPTKLTYYTHRLTHLVGVLSGCSSGGYRLVGCCGLYVRLYIGGCLVRIPAAATATSTRTTSTTQQHSLYVHMSVCVGLWAVCRIVCIYVCMYV